MVMPFSRSRSIESMTRSATSWLARNAPVWRSMASTKVVLPWSTWATMATLRSDSRRGSARDDMGAFRRTDVPGDGAAEGIAQSTGRSARFGTRLAPYAADEPGEHRGEPCEGDRHE